MDEQEQDASMAEPRDESTPEHQPHLNRAERRAQASGKGGKNQQQNPLRPGGGGHLMRGSVARPVQHRGSQRGK